MNDYTRTIRNARIEGTMLGYEDHGIFTAYLMLDLEDYHQGFGGYALDAYDKIADKRVGTALGLSFIAECCRVVGVRQWEDLKGQHVRADTSLNKIHRIGHITKNLWFDPKALFEGA